MAEVAHPGQPVIDIVLPTYRMDPDESEKFYPSVGKKIAEKVLHEELNGQVYDEEDAKIWGLNISDKVREAVRESLGSSSRYKIIVQTTMGQMHDQGIRVASRGLWDPNTDNYAAASYSNSTLFASVLIFALYTD